MIAVTAGVAAPLTILAGAVAVVFLAFTVAEFTKVEPSAGSSITYVETSLGPRAGVATALMVAVGYTVAIAGVFTMSGGMVAMTVAHYTSWSPSWEPLTLVLTAGAIWLTARFPLALYMFIGWENGPALAEECRDPRRTVPRAL